MTDTQDYDILEAAEDRARMALNKMSDSLAPEDCLKWSQVLRNCASAIASLKGEIVQDFDALHSAFQQTETEEHDRDWNRSEDQEDEKAAPPVVRDDGVEGEPDP